MNSLAFQCTIIATLDFAKRILAITLKTWTTHTQIKPTDDSIWVYKDFFFIRSSVSAHAFNRSTRSLKQRYKRRRLIMLFDTSLWARLEREPEEESARDSSSLILLFHPNKTHSFLSIDLDWRSEEELNSVRATSIALANVTISLVCFRIVYAIIYIIKSIHEVITPTQPLLLQYPWSSFLVGCTPRLTNTCRKAHFCENNVLGVLPNSEPRPQPTYVASGWAG